MSPEDLAERFCEMNTEEQARFFNTIGELVLKWDSSFYSQMESVVEEEKILTNEAKNIMRNIGSCGSLEFQGVSKKREKESIKLHNGETVVQGDLVYWINSDGDTVIDKIKKNYKTQELYFWNRNFKITHYRGLKKVTHNTILNSLEGLEEYQKRCDNESRINGWEKISYEK